MLIVHEQPHYHADIDETDELDIAAIYHELHNIMLIEVEVEHETVDELIEVEPADDEIEVLIVLVRVMLHDVQLLHTEVDEDELRDDVRVVLDFHMVEIDASEYLY